MLNKLFGKKEQDHTEYLYITFPDMTESFQAEKLFKEHKIPGKLISAPSFLTSGCGLAWRGPVDTEEKARKILNQAQLPVEQIEIH